MIFHRQHLPYLEVSLHQMIPRRSLSPFPSVTCWLVLDSPFCNNAHKQILSSLRQKIRKQRKRINRLSPRNSGAIRRARRRVREGNEGVSSDERGGGRNTTTVQILIPDCWQRIWSGEDCETAHCWKIQSKLNNLSLPFPLCYLDPVILTVIRVNSFWLSSIYPLFTFVDFFLRDKFKWDILDE